MKKKVIGITMLLLCAFCILCNINVIALDYGEMSMPKILAFAAILCCVSALYYALLGFKKHAAPAYTAYMFFCMAYCILCTIAAAIRFGGTGNEVGVAVLVASNAVLAAQFAVLFFAMDLGEKRSCASCWVILVLIAAQIVLGIVSGGEIAELGHANNVAILARTAAKCVLSVTTVLMITAKYIDKRERGTK